MYTYRMLDFQDLPVKAATTSLWLITTGKMTSDSETSEIWIPWDQCNMDTRDATILQHIDILQYFLPQYNTILLLLYCNILQSCGLWIIIQHQRHQKLIIDDLAMTTSYTLNV